MDCYKKAKSSVSERLLTDRVDLEKAKQECIREIATAIIKLRDAIYLSGKLEQDNFIQIAILEAKKAKQHDLETQKKNACFIRPLVRYKNGEQYAPNFGWVRIAQVPTKNDSKVLQSYAIKSDKNSPYGIPNYSKKPEWAKQCIKLTENNFRVLRENNEALTAMLRLTYSLSKKITEYHDKDYEDWDILGLSELEDRKRIPTLTPDEFKKMVETLHAEANQTQDDDKENRWIEELALEESIDK